MNPTPRTHYELLGLAPDADTAAIKSMYRKLVRTMHPDVGGNSALFGLITEAYECLRDPSSRAEYDRHLAAGEDSAPDPRGEEAGPNPYSDLFAAFEAFRLETDEAERREAAEAERAPLFTPWGPEDAARSDRQAAADARAPVGDRDHSGQWCELCVRFGRERELLVLAGRERRCAEAGNGRLLRPGRQRQPDRHPGVR